jgi:hypothetical protein
MSDSMDEGLPNLEYKLGKMIDKLIETDEDLEKNGLNSFSFRDEHCESKYKRLFEKEYPNNLNNNNNQNVNNSQIFYNNNQLNKSIIATNNIFLNQINHFQNNPSNISTIIYSNNLYPQHFYNPVIPQQMKNISNHSSIFSLNNSFMNTTTNSFSSIHEKSSDNNINLNFNKNKNNKNIYPNIINNSICDEYDSRYIFNKSHKYNKMHNNTFIDGNKTIFINKKNLNKINNNPNMSTHMHNYKPNNLFNKNAELELLLIQIKKILNKNQKIDSSVYNKCKSKFEQIIRTHKGSRIFQNYLKNTNYDILHLIFNEIKYKLTELLKDSYANYFCKKLFKNLSQKDRLDYLSIIQNDLNILSIDTIATYPIQSIIEELGSKNEKLIFYQGIKNSIDIFSYHIFGSRILEKILSYFESEFQSEIIEHICNNFIELAYNSNGICLVKKILLMTHKIDLHKNLKKLINENALNLIVHQYGNYAIQTIIENWDESDLEGIINIYKNKYVFLSIKKFSSNVIERILEKNEKNVNNYIDLICEGCNIIEILKNKYGNFVIKKAINLSKGKKREKLVKEINEALKFLDNQKIIDKWKENLVENSSSI